MKKLFLNISKETLHWFTNDKSINKMLTSRFPLTIQGFLSNLAGCKGFFAVWKDFFLRWYHWVPRLESVQLTPSRALRFRCCECTGDASPISWSVIVAGWPLVMIVSGVVDREDATSDSFDDVGCCEVDSSTKISEQTFCWKWTTKCVYVIDLDTQNNIFFNL